MGREEPYGITSLPCIEELLSDELSQAAKLNTLSRQLEVDATNTSLPLCLHLSGECFTYTSNSGQHLSQHQAD